MNWTELHLRLPKMTEADLRAAIQEEANGPARASHLTRMHTRLCKLRAARERRDLLRRG